MVRLLALLLIISITGCEAMHKYATSCDNNKTNTTQVSPVEAKDNSTQHIRNNQSPIGMTYSGKLGLRIGDGPLVLPFDGSGVHFGF